jgi:hypothetical protein
MILYAVVPGIQKFESGIRKFASLEIGPMFSPLSFRAQRGISFLTAPGPQIPRCARNEKPSMGIPIINRRDSRIPRLPNYKIADHESIFASRRRLTAVSEATGE